MVMIHHLGKGGSKNDYVIFEQALTYIFFVKVRLCLKWLCSKLLMEQDKGPSCYLTTLEYGQSNGLKVLVMRH